MIHPFVAASPLKKPIATQKSFFCLSLITSFSLLIPVLISSENQNDPLLNSLEFNWFALCCMLSIPLLFEFGVDTIVSNLYPTFYGNIIESRLAQFLIIISLALPASILFNKGSGSSSPDTSFLMGKCFIDFCQMLSLSAIFGTLHVFGGEQWTAFNSIPILMLSAASKMPFNVAIYQCSGDHCDNVPKSFLSGGIIMMMAALALHCVVARKYLAELVKLLPFAVLGPSTQPLSSNQHVCLILVAIVTLYLLVRILLNICLLGGAFDIRGMLVAQIVVHIVLAMSAAVLPGRMVRRGIVALKHEIETKKTFIRYISHEIRSPLATATMGLDILAQRLSLCTDKELSTATSLLEVVGDAKTAADIATSTLNDLLMFDKIETGMLQVSVQEADVWSFVTSCVLPFTSQADHNRISLTVNNQLTEGLRLMTHPNSPMDTDPEAPPLMNNSVAVRVDVNRMEQVIRNFLTNALKFTPPGGEVTVNVSVQNAYTVDQVVSTRGISAKQLNLRRSKYELDTPVVRIEVVDSGPGISAENLPKLFGQYVQFDANTLQGGKGSGLGLWLSKAIVEMHGGVIGASSDGSGRGCTFYLELDVTSVYMEDTLQHSPLLNGLLGKGQQDDSTFDVEGYKRVYVPLGQLPAQHSHQSDGDRTTSMHDPLPANSTDTMRARSASQSGTVDLFDDQDRDRGLLVAAVSSTSSSGNPPISGEGSSLMTAEHMQLHNMATAPGTKDRRKIHLLTPLSPLPSLPSTSITINAATVTNAGRKRRTSNPKPNVQQSGQQPSPPHSSAHGSADSHSPPKGTPNSVHSRERRVAGVRKKSDASGLSGGDSSSSVRNSARRRLNETELQSYYSRSSGGVNSELSAPVNLSAYRNLKVLLVDDSAIARKMVERTLTQLENCQCDHAHNGLEAVHKVAQSLLPGPNGEPPLPYDVVLMDYYMPVMSGPEAVHLIRQGGYRGVVLAVTGVSTDSEFTSLLGKGVDRILVKPFKLETFIHMMGGSGKRADSPFAVLPTQEELA